MSSVYMGELKLKVRSARADALRVGADVFGILRYACRDSAIPWFTQAALHAPEILRTRSLRSADAAWLGSGARFHTPKGHSVLLPGDLTPGAREMYARNVYLRTGIRIPVGGWVVDLGANTGLFTVLAAIEGATVVAVEAQEGFAPEIRRLLRINGIAEDQVMVETALISSVHGHLPQRGVVADDIRWRTASHAGMDRPERLSVPELMARYRIERIGLLKMDIEGSEFSVLHESDETSWLSRVDQLSMEVHPEHGDVAHLRRLLLRSGFHVLLTDDDGLTPTVTRPTAYLYACRVA